MTLLNVIILGIVQGLAELLPVSSSAHVVVAEKLLGLDPSSPPMTLLLVMLHTGTMFAVIVYFWRQWRDTYFQSMAVFKSVVVQLFVATALTGVVGEIIIKIIEHTLLKSVPHAAIEDMFSHLEYIAPALALAGVLIILAGIRERQRKTLGRVDDQQISLREAAGIGAVQGLCLPFRGFSRSGATISAALLMGISRMRGESFSFALAVVLTPPVVIREVLRLMHADAEGLHSLSSALGFSLVGAVVAFLAGLVALRWLSRWLESGRWYLFGIYCLAAAAVVGVLHAQGY
jgi:undecaprenyl-diphosphatase